MYDMICTPRPPTYGKNSMQHILLFKSIPVFEQLQDQNGQYVIAAEFRHGVVAADFVRYKIDHSVFSLPLTCTLFSMLSDRDPSARCRQQLPPHYQDPVREEGARHVSRWIRQVHHGASFIHPTIVAGEDCIAGEGGEGVDAEKGGRTPPFIRI